MEFNLHLTGSIVQTLSMQHWFFISRFKLELLQFHSLTKEKSRMYREIRRKLGRINKSIIERYLQQNEIRKLHIGSGGNILDGWLNADLLPRSEKILQLDATKLFPLGDEEFDYIFSEHMIEHISYPQGQQMLSECFRIMKRNARIRISTPDLAFLIDLYKPDKSDLQKEYIKWATDRFIGYAPCSDDTFVINNFVRDWGHQFIYDEKTLSASLSKAGFTNIVKCGLNQSEDGLLRNLEHEKRMPEGFLALETITLEGTKLFDRGQL